MSYLAFKTHILGISILMQTGVVLAFLESTDNAKNTLNSENKNSLINVELEVNPPMFFTSNIDPFLPYSSDTDCSLDLLSNNTTENLYQYHLDDTLTNDLDNNHTISPGYSAVLSNSLNSNVFNIGDASSSAVSETKVVFDTTSQKTSEENISENANINILPFTTDEFNFQTLLNHNEIEFDNLDLTFLDEENMFSDFKKNLEFPDLASTVDDTNYICTALSHKESLSALSGSDVFTHEFEEATNSTQQINQYKSKKIDINLKSVPNKGKSTYCAHNTTNQEKTCNYNVGGLSKELSALSTTKLFNTRADSINCFCKAPTCIDKRLGNNNRLTDQVCSIERCLFFPTRQLRNPKLSFVCNEDSRKRRRSASAEDINVPLKKKCTDPSKTKIQELTFKGCISETTDRQVSEQELNTSEFKSNISSKELSNIDGLTNFFQADDIPESYINDLRIVQGENLSVVLPDKNQLQNKINFISKNDNNEKNNGIKKHENDEKRLLVKEDQNFFYFRLSESTFKSCSKNIPCDIVRTVKGTIFDLDPLNNIYLDQIKLGEKYSFFFLVRGKTCRTNIEEPKTHGPYSNGPRILILCLDKKDTCWKIDYVIANIPCFFVDCFFKQAKGFKINSLYTHHKRLSFLCTLKISVTISTLEKISLRDIIPSLLLNYRHDVFCINFLKKIKNWIFRIKDFRSDSLQKNKFDEFPLWEQFLDTGSEDKTNSYIKAIIALRDLKNSSEDDNISDLGNLKKIKSILIEFKVVLETISKFRHLKFSLIIDEIRRVLTLFQKQGLTINPDKKYTKEDCKLLTLYFTLYQNYVSYTESLIYIYDIYLQN
ncbi:hypothetical protein CDIK_2784 [Cucumispora dikerogammari]|nr:hypothetical protein CDIK_2784 [Cucumispora dikerogammari]